MQSDFCRALLDPVAAAPLNLAQPASFDRQERFNVYRNNVLSSLIEALQQSFPVVSALVSPEAFVNLAAQFARQSPPQSAYLFEYGDRFPEFLAGRTELEAYPFIPEVAALEYAILRSTHAADAPPLNDLLVALATDPSALAAACFNFAPSVELLSFCTAGASIWAAHQSESPSFDSLDASQPEWVMLSRPGYSVEVDILEPAEFSFISALHEGLSVEAALSKVGEEIDLSACFQRLLVRHVLVGIRTGQC